MGERSLNKALFRMIILVIPTPGMHTISAILRVRRRELSVRINLFLRQLMNTKRAKKREIKEYHTFELVIAFLYLVAPKGAVCKSLLFTWRLILVSPRLVSCAPWAFARLACSAHGRMTPLKE